VECKIKADGALSSTVLISTSQTSAIFLGTDIVYSQLRVSASRQPFLSQLQAFHSTFFVERETSENIGLHAGNMKFNKVNEE
jgi:hypothetical protein